MNPINNEADYQDFDNKDKWFTKFIREWKIFAIFGVLFILVVGGYITSINDENKAVIKIKEQIQNIDSANNEDLKQIKLRQDNINKRLEIRVKLKEQLEKIVNRYNPLSLIFTKTYAEETENINDVLDSKIKRFCDLHELSDELCFEEDMKTRCTLILQGIYRFETGNLKSYVGNNIFNFRSPAIKKEWREKYGVNEVRGGFLVFPDKTNSIKFAVDRFYRIDRYKTIKMIVGGGCYISPVDSKKKCFPGYTFTEEHKDNYITYLKNYYKNNL